MEVTTREGKKCKGDVVYQINGEDIKMVELLSLISLFADNEKRIREEKGYKTDLWGKAVREVLRGVKVDKKFCIKHKIKGKVMKI